MSKTSRERRTNAMNRRTVLEGPSMRIRLKLEVLILFRKAVENGYEGSLSDWINARVMEAFKGD